MGEELSTGFKAAMRQLAGGVAIIAAGAEEGRRGLTATAVCSLSADPPRILVCVNRSAEAHDVIASHGAFSVSLLRNDQAHLAESFAALDGSKGAVRFSRERWIEMETGAPVLATGIAAFDCRLESVIPFETHTIYVGRVLAAQGRDDGEPLVYHRRRFRETSPIAQTAG